MPYVKELIPIQTYKKIFGNKIKSPGFFGLLFGIGVGGAGVIHFLTGGAFLTANIEGYCYLAIRCNLTRNLSSVLLCEINADSFVV